MWDLCPWRVKLNIYTKKYIQNSDCQGKLTLMKSFKTGVWYGEETHISNVNVFRNIVHNSKRESLD